MTKEECAIVTLYTGVAMLEGDDLEYLYRYAEKLMERPVLTHELVMLEEELKKRAEPDFINLCRWAAAGPVPSAQPGISCSVFPNSSDLISRRAAIDAYGDWYVEEGTEEGFIGTVKQLLEGLPSAQAEQQWIPIKWHDCTDEDREEYGFSDDIVAVFDCDMPNDEQEILVTTTHGYVEKDVCYIDEGFSLDSGYDWVEDIIAWMPLPEPWEKEE